MWYVWRHFQILHLLHYICWATCVWFYKGSLKKKKKKKEELKWDAQMNDTKKGHEHQTVPTMYYH